MKFYGERVIVMNNHSNQNGLMRSLLEMYFDSNLIGELGWTNANGKYF